MSAVEIDASASPEGIGGLQGFEALRHAAGGAEPAAAPAAPLSFDDVEWPEWTDREELGLRPMT